MKIELFSSKITIPVRIAVQLALLPISIVYFRIFITAYEKETTAITNGLALFAAVISALCYTAASVECEGSQLRASYTRLGRLFFASTIAGALGTAVKYSVDQALPWIVGNLPKLVALPIVSLYGACIGMFFYTGMISAHIGLWGISGILMRDKRVEQPTSGDADKPRA